MVEFGGYELPVQYTSIREEHRAVREAAGLFDVSHMGQIEFEGSDAIAAADRLSHPGGFSTDCCATRTVASSMTSPAIGLPSSRLFGA